MKSFEQIQTFIEVANAGSFAEASRRLGVSTSAVSARIQALEKHLNVRLLNRSTRSVGLTDEGQLYLERCEEMLGQLLDVEDSIANERELGGRIKLSVPLELPMTNLARLIQSFNQLHPKLIIEVHTADETVDFINDQIDLAIRGKAPGLESLIARKLGDVKLGFFTADNTSRRQSEWLRQPLIDPLNISALLECKTYWNDSYLMTHSLMLAKQYCVLGDSIALLPITFCQKEQETGLLKYLPDLMHLPTLPLYLVYPSRKHMPKRVRAFVDFLLENQEQFPLC